MAKDHLFETEQTILDVALADLAQPRYNGNELLPRYGLLATQYQKLLTVTRKIFRISDSQGTMLQRQQNDIQLLLDNANQGFLTFGADLKVDRQYSAACTKIFGDKIAGVSIVHLLGRENESLQITLQQKLRQLFDGSVGEAPAKLAQLPAEFRIGGKTIGVENKVIASSPAGGEPFLVMMILTDITEKLQAMDQIRFLNDHDKLTTLHNRDYVETKFPELEKPGLLPFSVIMADMNGLKLVNDVFGHQQGDLFLSAMSEALKEACRSQDIVARWGGDEFVVLMPNTDEAECRRVCAAIQQACAERTDLAIPLSAGVGMETQVAGIPRIRELLHTAEHRMYNDKLIRSRAMRAAIIGRLKKLLMERGSGSAGHQERVKKLALAFIKFLDVPFSAADQGMLQQLTQLHDIGMTAIPAEIISMPRPLTAAEWEVVKTHSEIGFRMAQSIGEPVLADTILALHERWDGTGYPCGLKADEIPFWARLFGIVDAYDAMTHDRPYKAVVDNNAALAEIAAGQGTQFDPQLAQAFLAYIGGQQE
jgi:diguanylate cyclase (GGDEF)-like protein